MKFLKNYLFFFFKKKKTLQILSFFNFFLPSYVLYQLFKNLIRVGDYSTLKKTFICLSKRSLCKKLKFNFFISKVVMIEIQKHLKIEIIEWKNDANYLRLSKVIKNPNLFLHTLEEKKYYYLLVKKIINEFIFCDSMIPAIYNYFNAELLILNEKKNIKTESVKLDNWWFQALGHIVFLDSLIKGILLKIIDIKKVSFDYTKICNSFLVEKYKNILIKNKIYQKKKVNTKSLNMRFWQIKKFNYADISENFIEYIQSEWSKKNQVFLNDQRDYKSFVLLKKKFGINSKIILVHVRQNDFHAIDENANARNGDIITTLKVLNKIKSNFKFIIIGAPGNKNIKNKFSNLFDYSNSKYKSDKNDILLMNFCDAFIGNTSGPAHYMLTRNKPCLYINWFPFELALKSQKCVILPKLIKKEDKVISINNFYSFGIRIIYDGIERISSLGYKFIDNSEDDIKLSVNQFIISLNKKIWRNYGKKYVIRKKNYDFFGISKKLKSNFLLKRKEIYFDPSFVKKNMSLFKNL